MCLVLMSVDWTDSCADTFVEKILSESIKFTISHMPVLMLKSWNAKKKSQHKSRNVYENNCNLYNPQPKKAKVDEQLDLVTVWFVL